MSVYVYASLCDFVCIALFLPIFLDSDFFCWYRFKACYHWWICSMVWLLTSFFLTFFYNFFLVFFFFLITLLLLLFSIFLSFFLSFLLSHVADRVLGHWPVIRPEPVKCESRDQDIGPTEASQAHIISNSESSSRYLHLNAKICYTQ